MNVRELAGRIGTPAGVDYRGSPPSPAPPREAGRPSFADHLRQAEQVADLKVSAHAEQRLAQRAISFTEADRTAVCEAIAVLEGKGARDALLVRPDAAFVVNVPSRTVVTAIPRQDLAQRVFTQIDSAMLL